MEERQFLIYTISTFIPDFDVSKEVHKLENSKLRKIIEINGLIEDPVNLKKRPKVLKNKMSDFDVIVAYLYIRHVFIYAEMKYDDNNTFLASYPEYQAEDDEEITSLRMFANFVNVIMSLKITRGFKGLTFMISSKIFEGWNVRYITGGGQSTKVNKRVHVFEIETDIVPLPRQRIGDRSQGIFVDMM